MFGGNQKAFVTNCETLSKNIHVSYTKGVAIRGCKKRSKFGTSSKKVKNRY